MKTVKLATYIENPDNPQTVTAEDFALLVESLRTMPQTLAASKIAYVTDYTAVDGADLRGQRVVIAGNKRLRALKQLAADHATSADGAIKFDGPLPAEWFYDLTPLGPDARRRARRRRARRRRARRRRDVRAFAARDRAAEITRRGKCAAPTKQLCAHL